MISRARGQRFTTARESAGLSILQAARLLGIAKVTLITIEEGFPVELHTLQRCAEVYGVSTAWLMAGTPTSVPEIKGMERLTPEDRDSLIALLETLPEERHDHSA